MRKSLFTKVQERIGDTMYIEYGEKEIEYLKKRDKKLGEVMDKLGKIEREAQGELFPALVNSIVGQQISTKAWQTVWGRIVTSLKEVTPENIASLTDKELQSFGLSFRKVTYIKNAANCILSGTLNLETLNQMTDEEVCKKLIQLDGVGVWTAEMLMIFSMQRMDVLSYGDLAIQRGIRMLYHHKTVTKEMFERYRKRYSPYGTVASFYLWAIAGGAVEGMKDYGETRGNLGKKVKKE